MPFLCDMLHQVTSLGLAIAVSSSGVGVLVVAALVVMGKRRGWFRRGGRSSGRGELGDVQHVSPPPLHTHTLPPFVYA